MLEIERKFLVHGPALDLPKKHKRLEQAYLMRMDGRSLRVRRIENKYILTLKIGSGKVREEVEQRLEREDGKMLMGQALEAPIKKKRYEIKVGGKLWEIDVFDGENKGLVLAEIELKHPDEDFPHPSWLRREVTGDRRFHNSSLATYPISAWRGDFEAMLAKE
ncbi:MAG: CYTH domain-containing protein [Alphaproteobacteria bacterium]|nr:MAG: CYTH domain-containing protein [Alphaproteobacteria bacterium]